MKGAMMFYAAVMLAISLTLLKRTFLVSKEDYERESAAVFESRNPTTLGMMGVLTALFIVSFFWLIALEEHLNHWLLAYAVYKTIVVASTYPRAVKPEGNRYPTVIQKLAGVADFLVILYYVVLQLVEVRR